MYDFFARNFRLCDHWLTPVLPAGTQPNRLMAMAGYSKVAKNRKPMEEHELVYDWLDEPAGRLAMLPMESCSPSDAAIRAAAGSVVDRRRQAGSSHSSG